MYENNDDLAINKLLLLYIIKELNMPLSKNQITEIILEKELVNYFSLQQYLSELISSKFIQEINYENKKTITISSEGSKVLSMFIDRVPIEKLDQMNKIVTEKREAIKKDLSIQADYTIEKNNNLIVNLRAIENEVTLIDLKINVPTKKHAIELCKQWKDNPTKLYTDILNVLIKF